MSWIAALARMLVVGFWLATSAYAFLTAVPFVYEQFLQPGLVPALVTFARWHGALAVAAAGLAVVALRPELAHRQASGRVAAFLWLSCLAAVAIVVGSPLTSLEPGLAVMAVSAAALVPVVLLAIIDLSLAPWADQERPYDPSGRDLAVVATSAVVCVLLFAMLGRVSAGSFDVHGAVLSLTSHGLLFAGVFAVFSVVRAAGDLTSKPAQWEALAAVASVSALTGVAAMLVIPPALSLREAWSKAVVFLFGAVIGLALAARGVRRGAVPERDGIALALAGALPRWTTSSSWTARTAWIALALALLVALRAGTAAMDWNFVVAKLTAVIVWVVTLATAAAWVPRPVVIPRAVPLAACLAWLAIHLAVAGRLPVGPVTVEAATRAADAWAIGDPSFRTLRDWLHRPVPDGSGTASATADGVGFFDFLQAHTNIARSIEVEPVPVRLADLSMPPAARAPHVFVFVIDSLRRDYVSPYNPRVGFTPSIGQFAADSTVFQKAFTRYGATGLSVPSTARGRPRSTAAATTASTRPMRRGSAASTSASAASSAISKRAGSTTTA